MDAVTKDLLRNLLQRDPADRLGYLSIEEIKRHRFFSSIQNWDHVYKKRLLPPFKPGQEPKIKLMAKGRETMLPKCVGTLEEVGFELEENLTDSPSENRFNQF